jgi:hypothetical protein
MTICRTCGNAFRKGKRRHVLLPDGTLKPFLVCGSCAAKAVSIVPVDRGGVCSACRPTSEARTATLCSGCANTMALGAVRGVLQPYADKLRKLAKAYRLNSDPKHEGLDMAADVLERIDPAVIGSGDFGPLVPLSYDVSSK